MFLHCKFKPTCIDILCLLEMLIELDVHSEPRKLAGNADSWDNIKADGC